MSRVPVGVAFLATFSFNCLDATVAYLSNIYHMPVYQIICFRDGIIFLGYLTFQYALRKPDPFLGLSKVRHWIWARRCITSISLIYAFQALTHLSISVFSTAFCLRLFATALMCRLFVGEPFPRFQAICCVISFGGVLLITDPFRAWSSARPLRDIPMTLTRSIDDGLPDTFIDKVIGVSLVIPCVTLFGGEMVTMRLIKYQADCSQFMSVVCSRPAVVSAL